jgi:hypothetical protein
MQLPAIRSHPWLAAEITRLPKHLLPAQCCGLPPSATPSSPHDLELLGALAFLQQCVRTPSAREDGDPPKQCVGDLRFHVLPEIAEEPPQFYTLRLDDLGDAFVLPGSQEVVPVATLACRREQLVRWVAGVAPLIPSVCELPLDSQLAIFLGCFHPRQESFAVFCREKGVLPSKSLRRRQSSGVGKGPSEKAAVGVGSGKGPTKPAQQQVIEIPYCKDVFSPVKPLGQAAFDCSRPVPMMVQTVQSV